MRRKRFASARPCVPTDSGATMKGHYRFRCADILFSGRLRSRSGDVRSRTVRTSERLIRIKRNILVPDRGLVDRCREIPPSAQRELDQIFRFASRYRGAR